MHDFQFFAKARVEELLTKEAEFAAQKRTLTAALRVSYVYLPLSRNGLEAVQR
jgi:hypothetical protein